MKTIILITCMLSSLLWTSCKNDGFYYQDEARIRIEGPSIWSLGTDSLLYSFASYPTTTTTQEIIMTLYVMGRATDYNRTAKLEVEDSKSSAASSYYSIPTEIVIPAGKLSVEFAVILNRLSDLQEKTVSLYINVVENEDFKPGVVEQNHFLIKWNDVLSKPTNWDDDLREFFGTYSLVKYRFIIDTIGRSDFNASAMSWAELNNYKIVMKNALNDYNEANPSNPLRDENGLLVSF